MNDVIVDSFRGGCLDTADKLIMIVIYLSPADYPGKYMARIWKANAGCPIPTRVIAQAATIEGIRKCLPKGMLRFDRHPGDAKCVVETWI